MTQALSEELLRRGLLDATTAGWAASHTDGHGRPFDTALLELDLVDEEELLDAMQACTGLEALSRRDLDAAHRDIGERLPEGFSRTFRMCPWALEGSLLVALVEAPLPDDWLSELRDLFGLEVDQRIAPAHYLTLGREIVYGTAAPDRARELEARLSRRRAADVRRAVERVSGAMSLRSAVDVVLGFAEGLLERAGFLLHLDEELYVAAGRGWPPGTDLVSLPDAGATLHAALRHGGFFAGPVAGTEADRRFWEGLGVEVPRAALVVPVPADRTGSVVFHADNGARGIPTRRVAELTLLVSRLGPHRGEWATLRGGSVLDALEPEPAAPSPPPEPAATAAASARSSPAASATSSTALAAVSAPSPSALDPTERAVVDRLREAAAAEGVELEAFVDALLAPRAAPRAAEEPSVALVGEVRGLFEKLAQDIPAQLARGMETAFRDMVPRIATAPAPATGPASPAAARPSAAAGVDLVQKEPAKREVASYRSRRAKTKRVKL